MGFLAVDAGCCRLFANSARRLGAANRVAWAVVGVLVAYSAVNVVVARVFSTPLTLPMLGATGFALSDSIPSYVAFNNLAAVLAVVASAGLVAGVLPPALPRAVKRGFVAIGAVCIVFGPTAAARIETLGLHRNAAVVLVRTCFARVPELSPAAAVSALPHDGRALNLSHLAGAARGRNVFG